MKDKIIKCVHLIGFNLIWVILPALKLLHVFDFSWPIALSPILLVFVAALIVFDVKSIKSHKKG